ncbi:hypothetical protein PAPHI01_1014 [Pancytospora philotis]|nr:hypothetical protein PAPHI01_1014 [Pancytospora philotis]
MLARHVLLLPLCCAFAMVLDKTGTAGYTCADFNTFGDPENATLNALEVEIMAPLCQYCIKHTSPEIILTVVDASPNMLTGQEMVRLVLFSVLMKHAADPHFTSQLVDTFDFKVHVLLAKLFHNSFMDRFKTQGHSDLHSALVSLVETHQHAIEDIRRVLRTKMVCLDSQDLSQILENNRATTKSELGLMIVLFTSMRYHKLPLDSTFERLMNSWPNDADRLDKLIPIACEFVRLVHRPPLCFFRADEVLLERAIVKYVASAKNQVCFELIEAISYNQSVSHQTIPKLVNKHLTTMKRSDISIEFSSMYARYMPTVCGSNLNKSLGRFFKLILPPVPAFHDDNDILWNREPRYFNDIPHTILREVFTDMHKNIHYPGRVEQMKKYMNMLKYDVFIDILNGMRFTERWALADFMVFYMDEGRREEYRSSLSRSRANGPHGTLMTAALNTIERALGAH